MRPRVFSFLTTAALAMSTLPVKATPAHAADVPSDWQRCSALTHDAQRLSCYDAWAKQQMSAATPASTTPVVAASISPPAAVTTNPDVAPVRRCNDPDQPVFARVWELTEATDCGVFTLRGYRPNTVGFTVANSVNRQPFSPAPDHSAGTPRDYRRHEARIQLSLRTKLAKGLFADTPDAIDSLWFGYTQRSNWQVFNGELSRPFRTTDHEPELVYVYPINRQLGGGWTWTHAGLGLVHQSNGQSLPLSRSWNRVYLMTGLELDRRLTIQARVWKRIQEGADKDDNPRISDYVGRGEIHAAWQVNADNTLSTTLRSSFGRTTRGSAQVDWFRTIGRNLAGGPAQLRFHTQLFTGYGDSLIDYNRKRTVLMLGFSLMDF